MNHYPSFHLHYLRNLLLLQLSDMPTRSGRNRTTTSPSCQHCGRTGHTENICPKDDYSPDVPALTSTQCVRRFVTATGGISQFQMVCAIDPCAAHSTLSAQPPTPAAPSALSSAMASLAGATPSQPPAPLNPPQPPPVGPNPTPPTNPPAVPNPRPSSSAPPGRNTTRSYSLATIDRKYNQIVSLVNGGTSLEEAYTMTNVKRRTFRRYRTVAEARLVDELSFSNLIRQVENPTLEDCETKGKQILQRTTSKKKLNELFLAGVCLKPLRK